MSLRDDHNDTEILTPISLMMMTLPMFQAVYGHRLIVINMYTLCLIIVGKGDILDGGNNDIFRQTRKSKSRITRAIRCITVLYIFYDLLTGYHCLLGCHRCVSIHFDEKCENSHTGFDSICNFVIQEENGFVR